MIGSLETSLSSLNTHGLMAQAQQQLTGPAAEAGRLPLSRDAVAPVDPAPSLQLNADALKAQEAALELLDGVFAAANGVMQQLAPVWEARQSLGAVPEPEMAPQAELLDHRIRDLLQNSRFDGAPLFDLARINPQTLEGVLKQPPETSRIELFSPAIRACVTEAFEQAFDLYA
jgi:hypothetical protein